MTLKISVYNALLARANEEKNRWEPFPGAGVVMKRGNGWPPPRVSSFTEPDDLDELTIQLDTFISDEGSVGNVGTQGWL